MRTIVRLNPFDVEEAMRRYPRRLLKPIGCGKRGLVYLMLGIYWGGMLCGFGRGK